MGIRRSKQNSIRPPRRNELLLTFIVQSGFWNYFRTLWYTRINLLLWFMYRWSYGNMTINIHQILARFIYSPSVFSYEEEMSFVFSKYKKIFDLVHHAFQQLRAFTCCLIVE